MIRLSDWEELVVEILNKCGEIRGTPYTSGTPAEFAMVQSILCQLLLCARDDGRDIKALEKALKEAVKIVNESQRNEGHYTVAEAYQRMGLQRLNPGLDLSQIVNVRCR